MTNTTAFLPIVYGSIAFYLGKQADEFQTHEWTLFLRGPNNEDLSPVIAKVVFQLHASFSQPVREYTQPPFEVTERGWGEFEAQIRIHWKDPLEKTTVVSSTNEKAKIHPRNASSKPNFSFCNLFYTTIGKSWDSTLSSWCGAQCLVTQRRCGTRSGRNVR